MAHHILPVADIFTYSLVPNYFNILVRVKQEDVVISHFKATKKKDPPSAADVLSDFTMERFSNWLNGYTKAYNKMYDRKGALFIDYMKRSNVENDAELASFISYIHFTSVNYGLRKKVGDWQFDGYRAILGNRSTFLLRNEVLDLFGNKGEFIKSHERSMVIKPIRFKTL